MKVKIEAVFKGGYGERFMGKKVIIDKIRPDKAFASGIKCRVINLWKRPAYLDFGWFK